MIAAICVRIHTAPSGDINKSAANECYIWPFLLAGPAAGCAIAWGALTYL
jgi:hypothetical protein